MWHISSPLRQRMMRSSIIATLALVAVGCMGNSDATEESVASHFESPEVEGRHYREAFVALDKEYNILAARRHEAYMLRDSVSRAEALLANDRASVEHSERLRLMDSAWLVAARHFYEAGDGGFTTLAEEFGSDSVALARRLLRL